MWKHVVDVRLKVALFGDEEVPQTVNPFQTPKNAVQYCTICTRRSLI